MSPRPIVVFFGKQAFYVPAELKVYRITLSGALGVLRV